MPLNQHLPNCTPVNKCAHCLAIAFLLTKITTDDLLKFLQILGEYRPSNAPAASAELSAADALEASGHIKVVDAFTKGLCNELNVYIGVRTAFLNRARNENWETLADLAALTEAEILRTDGLKWKALYLIKGVLGHNELRLNMEEARAYIERRQED